MESREEEGGGGGLVMHPEWCRNRTKRTEAISAVGTGGSLYRGQFRQPGGYHWYSNASAALSTGLSTCRKTAGLWWGHTARRSSFADSGNSNRGNLKLRAALGCPVINFEQLMVMSHCYFRLSSFSVSNPADSSVGRWVIPQTVPAEPFVRYCS